MSFAALVIALAACNAVHAKSNAKPHTDPAAPDYTWPAADYDHDGVFDRVDHCPGSPAGCIVDQYGCSIDRDGDGVGDGLDRCADTPYGVRVDRHGCALVSTAVHGMTALPAAWAPAPEELRKKLFKFGYLEFDSKVFFNTASSNLRAGGKTILRQLAQLVASYPSLRFEIAGHADSRGTVGYNRGLSQARAQAVRRFLMQRANVNENQLVARGYGESQIAARERSAAELQANRRVEFRLVNPEALPRGVKLVKPLGPVYAGYYR